MKVIDHVYHGARWLVDPECGIISVNRHIRPQKKVYDKVEHYLTDVIGFRKIDTRNLEGTITPDIAREREKAYRHWSDMGSWKEVRPEFREPIENLENLRDGLFGFFEKTKYRATYNVFGDNDGNIAYLINNKMSEKSVTGQTLLAVVVSTDLLAITYNKILDIEIVKFTHDIFTLINIFTASEGTNTRWLHEYAIYVPLALYAWLAIFSIGVYLNAYMNRTDSKRSWDPIRPSTMTRNEIEFPMMIPKDITVVIKISDKDESYYNSVKDDVVGIMKVF